MGLTVGQTIAGVGGGGGGGGGGGVGSVCGGAASSLRGGPGKAELLLELAQMARTLSISQSPDDKIVFRVFWLTRSKTHFYRCPQILEQVRGFVDMSAINSFFTPSLSY